MSVDILRIISFIFYTNILFGIHKSTANKEENKYAALVDMKVADYDETDEVEEEKPDRKVPVREIKSFVGTNLFGEGLLSKKCFSSEDIGLLAARREFESLIPKDLPDCLLDDELAKIIMQYFYGANHVIEKMSGPHSKIFAQKAFFDAMGGYLKYYMIPISRYSYYAGLLKLQTVENVLEIYNQCKESLNTYGNGWRTPLIDFTDLDIQIEPLKIIVRDEEEDTSCIQLELFDENSLEDDDMIVALPRLEPEEKGLLGSLWLPFKGKRTFNLRSYTSAFVLLKYFVLTTKCYNFQGICQDVFNKKFKNWILENLEIHLGDDVLYPGFGAILRIKETLSRKNKDTVIVMPKTTTKRQKTQNYKTLENKAKQLEKTSHSWLNDVFDNDNSNDLNEQEKEEKAKADRLMYIYIAIVVSALILLIVFLFVALALIKTWCRRSGNSRNSKWFNRKPPEDDEELLIDANSSSIPSSNKSKLKSKSIKPSKTKNDTKRDSKRDSMGDSIRDSRKDSTTMDNSLERPRSESTKCFGLCTKHYGPAIIETSSMDSDSGRENNQKTNTQAPSEEKTTAKAKPKTTKTTVVDERKRFSISKKNKEKDLEKDPLAPRLILPKILPNRLLDEQLAGMLMLYFHKVNKVIDRHKVDDPKIAQIAFFDALGGYLKHYLIPIARHSFYAGVIKLKTVENIHELYSQCKRSLNTNGNGWISPINDFSDLDFYIQSLKIETTDKNEDTSCLQLNLLDKNSLRYNSVMLAELPKLEPDEKGLLGSIWLPLKRKSTFNLQLHMSAFVILEYFSLVTRCYQYLGICQQQFNRNFQNWILENLESHLEDAVFYPGLGAVLRIKKTLRKETEGATKISEAEQNLQNGKMLDPFPDSRTWLRNIFRANSESYLNRSGENRSIYTDKTKKQNNPPTIYIYIDVAVFLIMLIFVIAVAYYIMWRQSKFQGKGSLVNEKDEEAMLKPESSHESESSDKSDLPKEEPSINTEQIGIGINKNDKKFPFASGACCRLCSGKKSSRKVSFATDSKFEM